MIFTILFMSFQYVPNRIIIKYDSSYHTEIAKLYNLKELSYNASIKTHIYQCTEDPLLLSKKLMNEPGIIYAIPDGIMHAFFTPNDPYFSYQWSFNSAHLNMEKVWDNNPGGYSSVIVAIVDTGIAFEDYTIPSHETGEVSSSDGMYHKAKDLDGVSFVSGYDFINNDNHPNDENGHGTHVAGTVAQRTNNNYGVAGIAYNVSLMPVRVLDNTGTGSFSAIANGITYAVDHGADVINLSLGGAPGDSSYMNEVHDAIKYAVSKNCVVVAATGNDGKSQISYPGGFEECIAVGATDYNNRLSYYSNYGTGIDIVAPGGDITKDLNSDGMADGILQETFKDIMDDVSSHNVSNFAFVFLQGTSMATPHVSAIVALLKSKGYTSVSSIKSVLYNTATDLGAYGYDNIYGYGLVNPVDALGGGSGEKPLTLSIYPVIHPVDAHYLDVYLYANRLLKAEPQITVKANSSFYTGTLKALTNTYGYVSTIYVASTGNYTINVVAENIDTSFTFTFSQIAYIKNAIITSDKPFYLFNQKEGFSLKGNNTFIITLKDAYIEKFENGNWKRINTTNNVKVAQGTYRIVENTSSLIHTIRHNTLYFSNNTKKVQPIKLIAVNGRVLKNCVLKSNEHFEITLPSGIYFLKTNKTIEKILIQGGLK